MTTPTKSETSTRRRFLNVAAAGAAATVAAPSIVNACGGHLCADASLLLLDHGSITTGPWKPNSSRCCCS
jgi:Ubiquitinol-cytochrome C reductase Fe-S subunit TAT signal